MTGLDTDMAATATDIAQMEDSTSIRQFWFGGSDDDRITSVQQAALWWSKNELLDQQMRARFAQCVQAAAHGVLDAWATRAEGLLALILLTDQFPRNLYRQQPQAFALDHLARGWCRQALQQQLDRQLQPIERVFIYLPLEHSEQLADQEQAVALFEALLASVAPAQRDVYQGYLDFARQHHAIIQRFGRFPHRNAILGRPSSAAECAFLQQPGSSF